MECRSCGKPIRPRTHKLRHHGYINQCDECGTTTERFKGIRRSVGLVGGEPGINKSGNIEIFRNPSLRITKQIKGLNSGMYSATNGMPLGAGFPTTDEGDTE
jgi:hypothetical protein